MLTQTMSAVNGLHLSSCRKVWQIDENEKYRYDLRDTERMTSKECEAEINEGRQNQRHIDRERDTEREGERGRGRER